MASFTDIDRRMTSGVDLSMLPPPSVIDEVSVSEIKEEIEAAFLEKIKVYYPNFELLASDPAAKLIEVFAYREKWLRERINEASRQCMIAYAAGPNLDNLGAFYGIKRGSGESDHDYRRRVVRQLDIFSTAGAYNAWVAHTYEAAGEGILSDVFPYSGGGGNVLITVLFKDQIKMKDDDIDLKIKEIYTYLNSDNIRPLTDIITVERAKIVRVEFTAKVTIPRGVDKGIVRKSIIDSLKGYGSLVYRIKANVPMSGLHAALFGANVLGVEITTLTVNGAAVKLEDSADDAPAKKYRVIRDIEIGKNEAPLIVIDENNEDFLKLEIER